VPRIPIPWPQDFIIGQGRKPRLLFDELDIHQFVQGAISIIEREDDLLTVRAKLAQLRATMRDAQFHGFESARYAYGTILSLLEDGTVTWTDSQRIADQRRSALIARGPSLREQATNPQRYREVPGTNARGGGGRSVDELVARQVPGDLCELNNDFNLNSYNAFNHCNHFNSVSIVDNVCFDIVSTHDNAQDNVIVNDIACDISGIDTNYDLHVSSNVLNDCGFNGYLMLYCVKSAFCMRAKQFSVANKIANGLLFDELEFNICNFLDVNNSPCLHTQVHTGSNYSVIKCLALNVSVFNFYVIYACNFDCTSFCLFNIENIANIATSNSAYVFDDVVSCTNYFLRMFVRHNLYIAHVLSQFSNAISGPNWFLRGSSNAYSIDYSETMVFIGLLCSVMFYRPGVTVVTGFCAPNGRRLILIV
jgi:hypothetical protein